MLLLKQMYSILTSLTLAERGTSIFYHKTVSFAETNVYICQRFLKWSIYFYSAYLVGQIFEQGGLNTLLMFALTRRKLNQYGCCFRPSKVLDRSLPMITLTKGTFECRNLNHNSMNAVACHSCTLPPVCTSRKTYFRAKAIPHILITKDRWNATVMFNLPVSCNCVGYGAMI